MKYPIHPDFRKWAHLHPPLNRALLPFLQWAFRLVYKVQKSSKEVSVRNVTIPVQGGTSVSALLFSPTSVSGPLPCLFYFHGGGYVFPAAPHHFRQGREFSQRLKCNVLFPDYRLAPQYPFPTAPEDCYASYCWAIEHAKELNIDTNLLSVFGDSAGSCLSTVVCIMAKERGQILPRSQVLIYPAVGLTYDSASMREFTDTPMCNSKDAEKYNKFYIQDQIAEKRIYHAPIEAEDLSFMPPAYIETAQFDCLRDGGERYAQKLPQAVLSQVKGSIHGFDASEKSPIVRDCIEKRINFIQKNWKE